jgi:hypothetical protein
MSALRDAIVKHLQGSAGVTALATGGIYPGLPPEGAAAYPFITVTAQQAPAGAHVFQETACENAVFLAKAIDRNTSPKLAGQINAAIRAALDRASLTIVGYSSLGIIWLGNIEYDEEFNGQIYQHEGGLYSLMARAN